MNKKDVTKKRQNLHLPINSLTFKKTLSLGHGNRRRFRLFGTSAYAHYLVFNPGKLPNALDTFLTTENGKSPRDTKKQRTKLYFHHSLPTFSSLEQWGRLSAVIEELFTRADTEDRQITFSFLVWSTTTKRYVMESHNVSVRQLTRKWKKQCERCSVLYFLDPLTYNKMHMFYNNTDK